MQPCKGNCGRACPGCSEGLTGLRAPNGEPWCLECWDRLDKDKEPLMAPVEDGGPAAPDQQKIVQDLLGT
jgi:hypothetical protein